MIKHFMGSWKTSGRRGIGLVVVMAAMAVLALFTGAILMTTVRTLNAVNDGENTDRARYAAYSGIQSALSRLNQPGQAGWSHAVQSGTVPPSPVTEAYEDCMQVVFQRDPDLQAIVTVYNNSSFCPVAYRDSVAPDGTTIPEGQVYICSSGIVEGKKKLELTSIGSLAKAGGYEFNQALLATGLVNIADGQIDCFNSVDHPNPSSPPYTSDFDAASPATWKKQAHVGSMQVTDPLASPADPPVVNVTAGKIDGDVKLMASDTNYFVDAAVNVTGLKPNGTNSDDIPRTFAPEPADVNTTWPGGHTQVGTPLALTAGYVYYCAGDLNLSGGASLSVTGGNGSPAIIYVAGNTSITDCPQLNMTQRPRMLQIYVVDQNTPTRRVNITNSKASMLVAGKTAAVNITNSELFGAALAGSVDMSGSSLLHYDVTLLNLAQGKSDVSVARTVNGTDIGSRTVTSIVSSNALPPAAPPPGPAPAPVPGPAPAPAPGGCGCGCGCMMATAACD